ncbi:retrotransposable element Tf2 [Tanacetum coccineum]
MAPATRTIASTSINDEPVTRQYVEDTLAQIRQMITGLGAQNNLGARQASQFSRLAKVEFPKFYGEDVMGWIFKYDQFFLIDSTPEEEKVKIVSVHLFDKALLWHRQLIKSKGEQVTWNEYKEAITLRFGLVFDDPMAALKNAKYDKSAKDYQDIFDNLLCRVEVSEEHVISLYLGGLPTELEMAVRMFKPKTLSDAYCLTTLQEATLEAVKKKNKPFGNQTNGRFGAQTNTHPRKQLTQKEYEEKRSKNLCFYCDQQYVPGHKCNGQLYSLIVLADTEEEEEEFLDVDESLVDSAQEDVQPQISLNALSGYLSFSSLSGWGKDMVTVSMCKDFQWQLYGQTFTTDVMLIPLGGCDMVLGIQWLSTLGDIKCNFKELKMRFLYNNTKVCLRGTNKSVTHWLNDRKQIEKLDSNGKAELMMMSIYPNTGLQLMLMEENEQVEIRVEPSLQKVLTEYAEVFEVPNKLPPARSHDHRIPLLHGTQPVNIRPYRHPPVQKDAIEAMIKELLEAGVIKHSQSSFASLIVMVKKKDNSWRMCVDYRQLNKHTIKDKFPIPVIEELIDELGGAMIFSKLDLRSRYHQIKMYEDDIAKTAFKTHEGHYEFLVMPFGLTNAPSTFQALMNDVFRDFLRKFTLCCNKMATSKSLAPKHQTLSTYEKEFLDVLLALEKWRGYLLDRHFVIKTDHYSLKFLLDQRISTPTQMKWLPKLMGYDYEVVYKQGKDNAVADALSRRENVGELLAISTTSVSTELYDRIVHSWTEDEHLQTIIADLKKGETRKHYVLHNDQLMRKGKLVIGNNESLREDLLSHFHDGAIGGLRKQVKQWVKECLICQKCKPDLSAYPGLLQPLPIPKTVWSSISMDFIEGLPKSHGCTVIFVVVDRLTKYAHFIPLSHPFTAMQVAQVFLAQVCKLHGVPESIVSDRDKVRILRIDWFKWLPLAELWYNSNYHSSIDTTPFEALYGQPPPVHVPYVGGWSKVSIRQGKQNKFSPKYFGPFEVMAKVGQVAYKLKLPSQAQIHDIFHVSQLKKLQGQHHPTTQPILPQLNSDGLLDGTPIKVLDIKMVKRNNAMVVYGLVQWSNGEPQDATWELLEDIYKKYPLFDS